MFNPRAATLVFVLSKVVLTHVFLRMFGFPCQLEFYQHVICIYPLYVAARAKSLAAAVLTEVLAHSDLCIKMKEETVAWTGCHQHYNFATPKNQLPKGNCFHGQRVFAEAVCLIKSSSRLPKDCQGLWYSTDRPRGGHMYPRKVAKNVLHVLVIRKVKGVKASFRRS